MGKQQLKKSSQGFTLIEMMIVVIIVSILAAFAIPGYLNSLEKSRRTEAVIALQTLAQQQEKFFSQYRTYTTVVVAPSGCAGAACGLNQDSAATPNGHYTMTAPVGTGTAYSLLATAAGTQLDDEDCRTFRIANTGAQAAADSGGNDNTDKCW